MTWDGSWITKLDDKGPCNGDVIVRTAKGSLVAVIYATMPRDDTVTMQRAIAFCKAAGPAFCSTCGVDTIGSYVCDKCEKWWSEQALLEPPSAPK